MEFSLEGKIILITGASSGIGRQCAIDCAKMGAKVMAIARNKERLDEILSQLQGTGHRKYIYDLSACDGIHGIHPGAKVQTGKQGVLSLKGRNTIGSCSRVVCWKNISIGENSGCSWNCQIFDTDFHFLFDMVAQMPLKRMAKIKIGDNVFIGNHCNIGKGVKIPNGCVVSSWSKVTTSFSKKGENLLISGNPASIVGQNYTMTHAWDFDKEKLYSQMLSE